MLTWRIVKGYEWERDKFSSLMQKERLYLLAAEQTMKPARFKEFKETWDQCERKDISSFISSCVKQTFRYFLYKSRSRVSIARISDV